MTKYWNNVWADSDYTDFRKYISISHQYKYLKYFNDYKIKKVCDIGCGFGKYSVISGINNYEVYGTDISERAISITKNMMNSFNLNYNEYKKCGISDVDFKDDIFDAVIAHAVIDHVTFQEAKKALQEFSRITKSSGLIYISFDGIDTDDLEEEHTILEDGSMFYEKGVRSGMIFKHYSENDIDEFVKEYEIIYRDTNSRGERDVILLNK